MPPLLEHLDRIVEHLARRHPAGRPARLLARLASPWAVTAEGLAAALVLPQGGRPALATAAAGPSAILLAKALKKLVRRPRPGLMRFKRDGKRSLPRAHVAGPLALLICLLGLAPPSRGARAALSLRGLATLVGVDV